jgi:hypothetical protein
MTEQEMSIEIAYRHFNVQNDNVLKNLKKLQFPESAIKFIFSRGYEARNQEIQYQESLEKQILDTLKKQFA